MVVWFYPTRRSHRRPLVTSAGFSLRLFKGDAYVQRTLRATRTTATTLALTVVQQNDPPMGIAGSDKAVVEAAVWRRGVDEAMACMDPFVLLLLLVRATASDCVVAAVTLFF